MNYYKLFPGLNFPQKSSLKSTKLTEVLHNFVSDVHLQTLQLIDQAIRYMRCELRIQDIDIVPASTIRQAIPLALTMQQQRYRYETESVFDLIQTFDMISQFDHQFIPTPWSDDGLMEAVSDSGPSPNSPYTDPSMSWKKPEDCSDESQDITVDGPNTPTEPQVIFLGDLEVLVSEDEIPFTIPIQNDSHLSADVSLAAECIVPSDIKSDADMLCTNTKRWQDAINLLELNSIPLVIYAPPCSGKTYFKAKMKDYGITVHDTQDILQWKCKPAIVVTDIPHVIKAGINSIAIIPDEAAFVSRYKRRNLTLKQRWYSTVLRYCDDARFTIRGRNSVWKSLVEISDPEKLVGFTELCARALVM